ncbi:hypothetical protein K439DRAFT_1309517, partial [Ramaria rubella]
LRLLQDHEANVPNFLGGPLPRRDSNNQEYYSATMLTLFKPWRQGGELKKQGENWVTAFETHSFSLRQEDSMKYLNIQYECLDSKDDYRAQMK